MELTFTVPGRGVSGNANWRSPKGMSKVLVSKAARDEKKHIRACIFAAAVRVKWAPVKWYATKFTFWNSLADLTNLFKVIEDAMQGAAIQNDRYHLETHSRKRWDDGGPRIEVTVREAKPEDYGRAADSAAVRAADARKRRVGVVPGGRRPLLPPDVARNLDRARPLPRLPGKPLPGPT
jgi:Holliday junction resolvase RusA-like endonuclease